MSPQSHAVCVAVVTASFLGCSPNTGPDKVTTRSEVEYDLLGQIHRAVDPAVRTALITKLEATPVNRVTFYNRWIRIHRPWALQCWTDDGYDPSLSDIHPDIQLLPSMCYGKSDIENGGLYQLFMNGTGVMAPEMQQWCERAGLQDTADVLSEAIAIFGPEFPRSQEARQTFLMAYSKSAQSAGDRQNWNPFVELDSRFYASLGGFDDAADKWLRDVCGISSLHIRPSGIAK